ncbi:hypothetical protein NORO109296_15900 [Nocardiopsis rhodophaea]
MRGDFDWVPNVDRSELTKHYKWPSTVFPTAKPGNPRHPTGAVPAPLRRSGESLARLIENGHFSHMSTPREELAQLVEELPESEVSTVLATVRAQLALAGSWPPAWFGAAETGETDVSGRVDEILAEGFGQ